MCWFRELKLSDGGVCFAMNKRIIGLASALCLCGGLLLAAPAHAQESAAWVPSFEAGVTAFYRGDSDLAVRHFMRLAHNGDERAQYYIAYMIDLGEGLPQNYFESANWYKKSAEQGYLPAEVYLGYLYDIGRGVKQNDQEAHRWYTIAARKGDPVAQNNLATMLREGRGYQADAPLAAKWYLQSAMQGNIRAQYNLATMYRLGEGIKQNLQEAVRWYQQAAFQGDPFSQNALAYMYRTGQGLPRDEEKALEWYRRAAEQGHMRSQYSIARMYERGFGGKSIFDAAVWYHHAAEQGDVRAQYRLGVLNERGLDDNGDGIPQDIGEAVKWYSRAMEKGSAQATVALADLYRDGKGVEKNMEKAVNYYTEAADAGDPFAQYALGTIFMEGLGNVPANPVAAYKWLSLAGEGTFDPQLARRASSLRVQISVKMNANEKLEAQRATQTWKTMYQREKANGNLRLAAMRKGAGDQQQRGPVKPVKTTRLGEVDNQNQPGTPEGASIDQMLDNLGVPNQPTPGYGRP